MPTNQQDVELILRARDLASRNFKDIATAVDSATDALAETVKAAAKGEASYAELTETLRDFERAQKAVVEQINDIRQFEKQSAALETLQGKLQRAQAEYQKLNSTLLAAGPPTEAQATRLQSLNVRQESLQKQVNTTTAKLGEQRQVLANAGIETDKFAEAQRVLSTTAMNSGAAINELSRAVNGYQRNLKAAKAAQDEFAGQKAAAAADVQQRRFAGFMGITEDPRGGAAAQSASAFQDAFAQTASTDAEKNRYAAERAASEAEANQYRFTRAMDVTQDPRGATARQSAGVFEDAAKQQEEAAAAAEQLTQFRQLAEQASATARGYETLANSQIKLTEVTSNATNAVNRIIDPLAAERESLGGLEAQSTRMAQAIATIAGPVKNYTEQMRQLQDVMKSVGEQAELIDLFRRQQAVVAAARAEFTAAQRSVAGYTAQIAAAAEPDNRLVESLKAAQAQLRSTTSELQKENVALAEVTSDLTRAGIATENLAGVEGRLASVARASTASVTALGAAQKQFGTETETARAKLNLFGNESRESLSLYQRIRGDFLGYAAGYASVTGAIELAKGSVEAYVQRQSIQNRLAVVVGNDQKKIGDQYAYVENMANRLGIGIGDLANAYASFAIAAKNTGLSLEQANFTFERLSEMMRILHTSSEGIQNAFTEIEHSLSKNKLQLDDLRRASNWIPGFEGTIAKGLGFASVAVLFEEMKKGAISSQVAMVAAAEQIRRQYSEVLPESLKVLQAQQGRFETAWFNFKNEIADAGWAQAYSNMLQRLVDVMTSAQGAAGAHVIADGFASVANVIVFVAKNLENLSDLLEGVLVYKATKSVAIFLAQTLAARTAVDTMAASFTRAAAAATTFAAGQAEAAASAAPVTAEVTSEAAAFAALGVSETEAGAAATTAAVGMTEGATAVGVLGLGLAALPALLTTVVVAFASLQIGKVMYDNLTWFQRGVDRIRAGSEYLAQRISMAARGDASAENVDALNDKYYKTFQRIYGSEKLSDIEAPPDAPGADHLKDQTNSSVEAMDRLTKLTAEYNGLVDDYYAAQDRITAADATQHKTQQQVQADLDASKKKYHELLVEKQKQLQPQAEALEADSQLPTGAYQSFSGTVSAGLTATGDWHVQGGEDKLAARRTEMEQALANKLNEIDAAYDKTQKLSLQARVDEITKTYAKIGVEIANYQKIGGGSINGKSVGQYQTELASVEDELKQQETVKYYTAAINSLLAERKEKLDDIKAAGDAGSKSALEGYEQTKAVNSEYAKQIEDMTADAIKFAKSISASPSADTLKFIADMQHAGLGEQSGTVARRDYASEDKGALAPITEEVTSRSEAVKDQNQLYEAGLQTASQTQAKIAEAYNATTPKILEQVAAVKALIDAQLKNGDITQAVYDQMDAKLKLIVDDTKQIDPVVAQLNKTLNDDLLKGVENSFDAAGKAIAGLADKTETWKQGIGQLEGAVTSFFSSLFKDLAEAILKMQLENMLGISGSGAGAAQGSGGIGGMLANFLGLGSGAGSGVLDTAAPGIVGDSTSLMNSALAAQGVDVAGDAAATAGGSSFLATIGSFFADALAFLHSGGTVGGSGMKRPGNPAWFINAPRFHAGTLGVGLKPDEVAAVLQRGEQVIGKDSPDNALSQARKGGGSTGSPAFSFRHVLVSDPDLVPSAMRSQAGEQITLSHLKNNAPTVRQILGIK